jgi:hypothetical protein
MVPRCAYYLSASSGVLRMDLIALDRMGPYRLILDGDTDRHIEYFDDRRAALDRWVEFDAAMRPVPPRNADVAPGVH